MRKSGLTGDEAYVLSKRGSEDTDALRKEFTEKLNKKSEGENIAFRISENNGLQIFRKK